MSRRKEGLSLEQLRVAVCEDTAADRERLTALIAACTISAQVDAYERGGLLLNSYRPGMYDLLFIDIYLGDITGVDAVRKIRAQDPQIPIIFTTVSKDFALDAYRLGVADYLEKPLAQEGVEAALHLALEKKRAHQETPISLLGRTFSIPVSRLLYVEQSAHYLIFSFLDNKTLQFKGSLDELEPQLSAFPFYRCHKSYLVNFRFVKAINLDLMLFSLQDGKTAYIRRSGLKKAKIAWEHWLFAQAENTRPAPRGNSMERIS